MISLIEIENELDYLDELNPMAALAHINRIRLDLFNNATFVDDKKYYGLLYNIINGYLLKGKLRF